MDEDWINVFGILMCTEICDGAGAGTWDGAPSACSSSELKLNASVVAEVMYTCVDVKKTGCLYPTCLLKQVQHK